MEQRRNLLGWIAVGLSVLALVVSLAGFAASAVTAVRSISGGNQATTSSQNAPSAGRSWGDRQSDSQQQPQQGDTSRGSAKGDSSMGGMEHGAGRGEMSGSQRGGDSRGGWSPFAWIGGLFQNWAIGLGLAILGLALLWRSRRQPAPASAPSSEWQEPPSQV